MFNNKKGVSPIIAAVLLVVITIAIGATTMAFIRSLSDTNLQSAQEQSAKITCGVDVRLDVQIIGGRYKICYSDDDDSAPSFYVMLRNTGNKDIEDFDLTTILANGSIFTDTLSETLAVNGYLILNETPTSLSTDANISDVLQWKLEPKIRGQPGKDLTICTDSSIIRDVEDILPC